jgi:hypothetical protein
MVIIMLFLVYLSTLFSVFSGASKILHSHSEKTAILFLMKVTKLEHACLDIADGDDRLIIDPGIYSTSLTDLADVTALVITHVHQDHFDPEKVKKLAQASPKVQIFSTQQVADQLPGIAVTVAETGKQYAAGPFTFEFFGDVHAKVITNFPPPGAEKNVGVLVNDRLYYPGDSFSPCPKPHEALACPANAPWMKMTEVEDFIKQDSAPQLFATHDHYLSSDGHGLADRLLSDVAEQAGKTYHILKPGESIEV